MRDTVRDWERRVCPNERCPFDRLVVKQWPGRRDMWWVARHEVDAPWTEASTVPVCPLCGDTLRTAASGRQQTSGMLLGEGRTSVLAPTVYAARLPHARETVNSPST